jgi:hypothetical protein
MNVICPECRSRLRIADEKVPELEGAILACPKCGGGVPVAGPQEPEGTSAPDPEAGARYDASEKPFDFLEAGSRSAIVCSTDAAVKPALLKAMEEMGYHVTEAKDSREALRNMWYHAYQIVLLDELFDTQSPEHNRVLSYLEGLNMALRREMVVVLVSRRLRTLDEMGAFQKSVNLIVNVANLPEIPRILRLAVQEHDAFYHVYKEIAKKETAL